MAVDQSTHQRLSYAYREQAPSHKLICTVFYSAFSKILELRW